MAGAASKLSYASGGTQVTPVHGGFVVTVPGPAGGGFWLWVAFVGGLALLCLAGTVWPSGVTEVYGTVVRHPGGVVARLLALSLTLFMGGLLCDGFRKHRTPVTLTVQGSQLTAVVPTFWGVSTRHYDLTKYRRALAAHDDGEPTALELRGGPDEPETLFNAFHYRQPDLTLAADALDEAIRGVDAGAALADGRGQLDSATRRA